MNLLTPNGMKKWRHLFLILTICVSFPLATSTVEAAKGGVKGKPDTTAPGQDKKEPEPEPEPEPEKNTPPGQDQKEPEQEPNEPSDDNAPGPITGVTDVKSDGGEELGFANGNEEKYHFKSLTLGGDMTVSGPVTMVIDGDFTIGNNELKINQTGSLVVYLGGSLKMNGNGGLNNQGVPANCIIYGTHQPSDSSSSITLNGNGAISAVVYAPYVNFTSNGGGNGGATLGSVVAENITFNGNPGPFLFDEALKDFDSIFDGYTLSAYKLMQTGNPTPSTDIQDLVESKNYDALFTSLFDD